MHADMHGNPQGLNESSGPAGRDAVPDEFVEFFNQQLPVLSRFLMQAGASLPDAQDAAQEAFIAAFRKWDQIERPRAWIYVVALRFLWRNARAAQVVAIDDIPEYFLPSPQDMIESRLQIADLRRLINSLPRVQRAVMAMHYDGFSSSEIASRLEISDATVRVHLHKARRQLKDLLALQEDDSQDDARTLRWSGPSLSSLRTIGGKLSDE
jgi:RNA polymerase sigma factor (sigma-70 family)